MPDNGGAMVHLVRLCQPEGSSDPSVTAELVVIVLREVCMLSTSSLLLFLFLLDLVAARSVYVIKVPIPFKRTGLL